MLVAPIAVQTNTAPSQRASGRRRTAMSARPMAPKTTALVSGNVHHTSRLTNAIRASP
jgi:hypothetical protein